MPRPAARFRTARVAGWSAAAALVVVIVVSKWVTASVHGTLAGRAVYASVAAGGACVTVLPDPVGTGWALDRGAAGGPLGWWPVYDRAGPVRSLFVPLWMPAALIAGGTAWLTRLGTRLGRGRCACGYALAGLAPGAPCPECGA